MKKIAKLSVFLALFTALAVGSTYVRIQRTLGEPLIRPKVDLPYEEIVPEQGIDLNGFYDQNHLVFTEVVETVGENEMKYPQIDGLKNDEVEAAVNAAIADKAAALKQSYADNGAQMNYMTYHVYASFSNVLSIGLFSGDTDFNYTQSYLNFNLNDGSELRLEELFGVQADLLGIVRSAFYDTLTIHNFSDLYWESAQSPDEQMLYRTVMDYMAAEEKEFFFTPAEIYLLHGDYQASVDMLDHAADITVYHKFLSGESLFERDDIGYKNIFTCSNIPEGHQFREFGYLEENFWCDYAFEEMYLGDYVAIETEQAVKAFAETKYDELREEIASLRETAQQNPDRMYLMFANPYVRLYAPTEYVNGSWVGTPSMAAGYNPYYKLYEMPKTLFDSKYRAILVDEYRRNPYYILMGGLEESIDGNDAVITRQENDTLYRYDSGEQLTADTVFAPGFDHAAAVRSYTLEQLVNYYDYTYEDAALAVQGVWYELAGEGLQVHVPAMNSEEYFWMGLEEFSRDQLTIYS